MSKKRKDQKKRYHHFHPPSAAPGGKTTTTKRKKTINLPPIPQTLRPTQQTQQAKTLRLHLNRDIEFLRNRICAKRHPARRPEEHHRSRQSLCRFGTVVAPDLRHELEAPAYCADGAKDVGGSRDGVLGGHGFVCRDGSREVGRDAVGNLWHFFVFDLSFCA